MKNSRATTKSVVGESISTIMTPPPATTAVSISGMAFARRPPTRRPPVYGGCPSHGHPLAWRQHSCSAPGPPDTLTATSHAVRHQTDSPPTRGVRARTGGATNARRAPRRLRPECLRRLMASWERPCLDRLRAARETLPLLHYSLSSHYCHVVTWHPRTLIGTPLPTSTCRGIIAVARASGR